jgi:translation initiation factor 6 (eIF-6)
MITDNLSTLKINKLTKAQYDSALAAGTINDTELYLVPDTPIEIATNSIAGLVKIGSNLTISADGLLSVPTASGTKAGVTIVYPAASCSTFSSDSGTVTPLAV